MAIINNNNTNNLCYGSRTAYIDISQISFVTESENILFSSFDIEWSGDIDNETILSSDSRLLSNLKNGTYQFIIKSLINNDILGPYISTITSPSELFIDEVQYQNYSCNNTAYVYISVSGGTPPYSYRVGSTTRVSNENFLKIDGLSPGSYNIIVSDNNNCSTTGSSFEIFDATFLYSNESSIPPTILDGFGTLKFDITGLGPFNLSFKNLDEDNKSLFINSLETEHISNFDFITNRYSYEIKNLLSPSTYSLTIQNNYGCVLTIDEVDILNISPLTVSLKIKENIRTQLYAPVRTLPIYDTIFIPYKFISNNSELWQYIKTLKIQDNIIIKINEEISEFLITRNMLDKCQVTNDEVEILKLGNNSDDWFFYFHIAPGLNPDIEPDLLNSTISIVDQKNNRFFDLVLGLSELGNIETEKTSIIRGSFILEDNIHNQFVNSQYKQIGSSRMDNVYVSVGDNTGNEENYQFETINTKKTIFKNLYLLNYVTTLNFLEKFNVLNQYVTTKQTICDSSADDYQYMINIRNLLRTMNNTQNLLEIYVYNLDSVDNNGSIDIVIDGNDTLQLSDSTYVDNEYYINYYSIDQKSEDPQSLILNNKQLSGFRVDNIKNGYFIIRIIDIYKNKPKNILYNNTNIIYDNHFIASKKILQNFNKLIFDKFLYGDILVYVGARGENQPIIDENIPRPFFIQPPTISTIELYQTIKQTEDVTNTSKLLVNIERNIKHWIYGPRNYIMNFAKNTLFINLLPGVYIIQGDEKDLVNNYLYQNEYRILVNENSENNIDIIFNSYQNQLFIQKN